MKLARNHYEAIACKSDSERTTFIQGLSGPELVGLLHYVDGREPSELRDEVAVRVMMIAGSRYLAKQAAKQAKKLKNIL
jgi:hypothetical protein